MHTGPQLFPTELGDSPKAQQIRKRAATASAYIAGETSSDFSYGKFHKPNESVGIELMEYLHRNRLASAEVVRRVDISYMSLKTEIRTGCDENALAIRQRIRIMHALEVHSEFN